MDVNIRITPGARMVYLSNRLPVTSRDELIAHWFAHHMPAVIAAQEQGRDASKEHARKDIAALSRSYPAYPMRELANSRRISQCTVLRLSSNCSKRRARNGQHPHSRSRATIWYDGTTHTGMR